MARFETLTDDEIYARWQERFERVKLELHHLFSMRRKFCDIQGMFQENERLNSIGSQAWEWLLLIWGRDAVVAVRRELDDDSNTISLGRILDEMAARPQVMTRRRYMAHMKGVEPDLASLNDRYFTSLVVMRPGSDPMDDHLDPDRIRADRKGLNAAAKPVLEYANRMVAHRTPVDKLDMTVQDIHDSLDAMEPVVKKYYVLLSGSALSNVEPVDVGDDWKEAFTFPWHVRRSWRHR